MQYDQVGVCIMDQRMNLKFGFSWILNRINLVNGERMSYRSWRYIKGIVLDTTMEILLDWARGLKYHIVHFRISIRTAYPAHRWKYTGHCCSF